MVCEPHRKRTLLFHNITENRFTSRCERGKNRLLENERRIQNSPKVCCSSSQRELKSKLARARVRKNRESECDVNVFA